MPKPQQPELRRSEEHAVVEDHAKTMNGIGTPGGTATDPELAVPEANQPGHHPERDQDKPDLDAFAERFGIESDRK